MSLTAQDMAGQHLIDLISLSNPEIASFGNSNNGAYVRWYDNNKPSNFYSVGVFNNTFSINSNALSSTRVGIATATPKQGANLHVQGTILTSNISTYNPNETLQFNGQNIGGISNITFNGSLYQGDSLFKTSQWNTVTPTSIYFPGSNVGIGGTANTDSNLFVVGDVVVTGKVTAKSIVERNQSYSLFTSAALYLADVNGYRQIITNAPVYADRILYSFTVQAGRYMVSGTIPYKNLSPMLTFDTFNWAYIGLYKDTPATFSSASNPICSVQLNSIGSTNVNDIDDVNISWFLEVPADSQYVVAINGKGHVLKFGPYFQQPVRLFLVPVKALGTGDRIDVRQKLQPKPIRKTLVVNTFPGGNFYNNRFDIETDGYYDIQASNVEIYYTLQGASSSRKLYYISPTQNEYSVNSVTFQNNKTYANISFTFTPATNALVDAIVWLETTADTFFEAGYLYQNFNLSSIPWQMVQGGGVKLTENKCVIDGDLFISGSIYGGCNTSTFQSGGIIADYLGVFEQSINIVNTLNISDKAVTVPKLDLFIGNVGIGTTTPPERLMVMGNIAPALNNTYSLGTPSLNWSNIYVGNQLISTVATGTAPFSVNSTTQVTNLNASLLEGNNAAFYRNATNMNAGTLIVGRGGIGTTTLATNKLLVGAGTAAITAPTNLHWDGTRLGIATVTPAFTLDVNGGMRIQNSTTAALTLNVGTAGGTAISTGNDSKLKINDTGAYTGGVIITGSVGIGNASPDKTLTVSGEIRASTNIYADTQFFGANGTASVPSYSWGSDTNTGIFRPSTDQIAISTGGTERMRVIDTGNVGIGSSNPHNKLVIASTSGSLIQSMQNVDGSTSTIGLTMGYQNDTNLFSIQKNKTYNTSLDGNIAGLANSALIQNKGGTLFFQNQYSGVNQDGHFIYDIRPMLNAYLYTSGAVLTALPGTSGTKIIFNNTYSLMNPYLSGTYDTTTGVYTCKVAGTYYITAKIGFNFDSYGPVPQIAPTSGTLQLQHINIGGTTTIINGSRSYASKGFNNMVGSVTLHSFALIKLQVNEQVWVDAFGVGPPRIDNGDAYTNTFNVFFLG